MNQMDENELGTCPILLTTESGEHTEILSKLRVYFQSKFEGRTPDFYVRVPGRVNLIGEHVDYCGYSVLPMAIRQNVFLAVKNEYERKIKAVNMDEEKYPMYSVDINFDTVEECGVKSELRWGDYLLCGIKGVLELCNNNGTHVSDGYLMAVCGDIPPAAGLSSSSALVCAAALSSGYTNLIALCKKRLASLSAKAERYIGTEGGGMDQAIAFCADPGSASHISFNPLVVQNVTLPKDAKFIIANSMIQKNKADSAEFNLRVVECRLASLLIGKALLADWKMTTVLAKLQKELNLTLEEMPKVLENVIDNRAYSKTEICQRLEITSSFLEKKYLTRNTRNLNAFWPYPRAMHVFQEAARVEKFRTLCEQNCSLDALGQLMKDSHESLRDNYQCSHPKLDELVAILEKHGAYGARLTGAGWGGCVVALAHASTVEAIISQVKKEFYKDVDADLDALIFLTEPSSGANVFVEPQP